MVAADRKHVDRGAGRSEIVGVDKVIAMGGVQAVAALTYGAGMIPSG